MAEETATSKQVNCTGCSHAEGHHQSESTACEWTSCGCPRFLAPPPVQHFRTGPARCNCGFDAYKLNGIMLDYAELFASHLHRAQKEASQRV